MMLKSTLNTPVASPQPPRRGSVAPQEDLLRRRNSVAPLDDLGRTRTPDDFLKPSAPETSAAVILC